MDNTALVKKFKEMDFWIQESDKKNFFKKLYTMNSDWIFGGGSKEVKALNQLNLLDWYKPGKTKIKEIMALCAEKVTELEKSGNQTP